MAICFKAAESVSYCQVLPFKKGKRTQIHGNMERGVLFPLGQKADTPSLGETDLGARWKKQLSASREWNQ